MELPRGKVSTDEYWTQHIRAAEKFKGTNKEYCQHAGIKYGSLGVYRRKLGFTRPSSLKGSKFATVDVAKSPTVGKAMELPDPDWLAKFLKAWMQS